MKYSNPISGFHDRLRCPSRDCLSIWAMAEPGRLRTIYSILLLDFICKRFFESGLCLTVIYL